MASVTAYPTSMASQEGLDAFTNLSNVGADDGSNATWAADAEGAGVMVLTGFDFSAVPDTATINGVLAEIEASSTENSATVSFGSNFVGTVLRYDGGDIGDQRFSDWNPHFAPSPALTVRSNGGEDDLWGATLTPQIVKSASFGIAIELADVEFAETATIDFVRLTITFTEAASVEMSKAHRMLLLDS